MFGQTARATHIVTSHVISNIQPSTAVICFPDPTILEKISHPKKRSTRRVKRKRGVSGVATITQKTLVSNVLLATAKDTCAMTVFTPMEREKVLFVQESVL
jgi:hypothetical protein